MTVPFYKQQRYEELHKQIFDMTEKFRRESAVIEQLPDEFPNYVEPIISNTKTNPNPHEQHGWISFHRSYGPERKYDPVGILRDLENGGWKPVPTCLCQYGGYAHSAYPGTPDSVPKTYSFGREELKSADAISPLFMRSNHHQNRVDVSCFMLSPHGGRIYRVQVDINRRIVLMPIRDGLPDPTQARLSLPPHWNSFDDGVTINRNSRTFRSVEGSYGPPYAEGVVYFAATPKTTEGLADFLEYLMGEPNHGTRQEGGVTTGL